MKKIALHWQILIALIISVFIGALLPQSVKYISWMGDVFLRALKMIVVPLVLTSLITGVTNIGSGGNLGRLGLKTIVYYMTTSLIAITTGLVLVNVFKPGVGADSSLTANMQDFQLEEKPISDTLIEIIPNNIFEAFTQGNMLAIIFFAILFGFFITRLQSKHKQILTDFFSATFEVMMKITLFIIKFAPLGILGIVSKVVAEQENIAELVERLGIFMLIVIGGLLLHSFVFLPLICKIFGKIKPFRHFKNMATPLLTAFSTASSNATLPLTMEAVEHNSGVSNKIASFTLPLGATINMDGTALYELAVAGFIAQLTGHELSFTHQFIMVATALLASIGTAGVPMASYVAMVIIFSAIGLPLEYMLLVLPVDRPLDMLRTATNVWSDSCGAAIIAKTEGEKLKV
ncbi:dicarboxylate/amino acid:cation symporter [Bacteroidota bacterium]